MRIMTIVWAATRGNLSSGVFEQHRRRPAYAFAHSPVASLHMLLSKKRTTKALIRLCGCAGWSAPVLFLNPRRHVFSRRGPFGLLAGCTSLHLRQLWVGIGAYLVYPILPFSLRLCGRSPDMTDILLTGTLSLNSINLYYNIYHVQK